MGAILPEASNDEYEFVAYVCRRLAAELVEEFGNLAEQVETIARTLADRTIMRVADHPGRELAEEVKLSAFGALVSFGGHIDSLVADERRRAALLRASREVARGYREFLNDLSKPLEPGMSVEEMARRTASAVVADMERETDRAFARNRQIAKRLALSGAISVGLIFAAAFVGVVGWATAGVAVVAAVVALWLSYYAVDRSQV